MNIGDEIVAVNSEYLTGLSNSAVENVVSSLHGSVRFLIVSSNSDSTAGQYLSKEETINDMVVSRFYFIHGYEHTVQFLIVSS